MSLKGSLYIDRELLQFVRWSKRWGYEVPEWSQVWDWSIQCADCGFQLLTILNQKMECRSFQGVSERVGLNTVPFEYRSIVENSYRDHFYHEQYKQAQCVLKFIHDR